MAAHLLGTEVRDAAPADDLSAVEDGVLLRESPGELDVLLHEQDGHPAALQEAQHALDVLYDGRLDPFGGLIEEEQRGPSDQSADDGELLLLAAGEISAPPVAHGGERGEEREQLVEGGALAAASGRLADRDVLRDRQPGKDLAPLRDVADAAPRPLVRREPGHVLVLEPDGPGTDGQHPHDAPEQRRLADAVTAEERDATPLGT